MPFSKTKQLAQSKAKPGQILSANLTSALKVAGLPDAYGRPGKLRSTQLQRNTGIARSTLRSLRTYTAIKEPNPDLSTLCRIADEIGIPVALLLTGPKEWLALMRAIDDMAQMLAAAHEVEKDTQINGPQTALQILRTLKVYPAMPPGNTTDPLQAHHVETLQQRNEFQRRLTLVVASLAQSASRDRKTHWKLTAFAASLANQMAAEF